MISHAPATMIIFFTPIHATVFGIICIHIFVELSFISSFALIFAHIQILIFFIFSSCAERFSLKINECCSLFCSIA